MPIIKLPRPGMSGAEKFKVMLEKTASPFVFQQQLQQRVEAEVRNARGRAVQYTGQADGLEPQIEAHTKRAEGWAAKCEQSGNTNPDFEIERAAALRAANDASNEMRQLRAAAREWDSYADALEAELKSLNAQLAAAAAG